MFLMMSQAPNAKENRVQNIKKQFEGLTTEKIKIGESVKEKPAKRLNGNVGSNKVTANKPPIKKLQGDNSGGVQLSRNKEVQHLERQNAIKYDKAANASKAIVKRSPAFRCDKIVCGKNILVQGRERTKSVVDRVKLFEEDGVTVPKLNHRKSSCPESDTNGISVTKSDFKKEDPSLKFSPEGNRHTNMPSRPQRKKERLYGKLGVDADCDKPTARDNSVTSATGVGLDNGMVNSEVSVNTLRAVMKAPLPPGPPPKKPPRTFAHTPILENTPPPSVTKAVVPKDNPEQLSPADKYPKLSVHDVKATPPGPVRSRTESQIDLKKLKSNLEAVLSNQVPAKCQYSRIENQKVPVPSAKSNSNGKVPLTVKLIGEVAKPDLSAGSLFGCLQLTCTQTHMYEKLNEKQCEFFVDSPDKKTSANAKYGSLVKSHSEEHIYAEPYDFLKENENYSHASSHKYASVVKESGQDKDEKKRSELHYMSSPILPLAEAAARKPSIGWSSEKSPSSPAAEPSSSDSDNTEPGRQQKRPPLQRLAALVKGGAGDGAKMDRSKIQLLMNQAFSTVQPLVATPDAADENPEGVFQAMQKDSPSPGDSDSDTLESGEDSSQAQKVVEERKGYIRRVCSRLYHRKPAAFPHLFECVLLVGLSFTEHRVYVPYIKNKFPPDADVPPWIEHFCFPDAAEWPPSEGTCGQTYSLVITSEDGTRRFGYCRRVLPEGASMCLPLAYCIISPFRANGFYFKVLAELESKHGNPEAVQAAFIKELYALEFPGPGQGVKLGTGNGLAIRRPVDTRLEERDLTELFCCLQIPVFLQLFSSLLLERKLLLVSRNLGKLSSCIEALQSILYPFSWQHTFIPVLPVTMLDICNAPTPYIMGILKSKDGKVPAVHPDDGILIDLDECKVLHSMGDEATILPPRLTRALKMALQLVTNTTQPQDASRNVLVSEAFVRMFVEVCGHYENHVVTQQDGKKVFERESFIKAVESKSLQMFLEWFTETAMFSAFIDSRLERGVEIRGIFEQRSMEHCEMEKNTIQFLKNYKVINKKVKTFGDKFKDWAPFT